MQQNSFALDFFLSCKPDLKRSRVQKAVEKACSVRHADIRLFYSLRMKCNEIVIWLQQTGGSGWWCASDWNRNTVWVCEREYETALDDHVSLRSLRPERRITKWSQNPDPCARAEQRQAVYLSDILNCTAVRALFGEPGIQADQISGFMHFFFFFFLVHLLGALSVTLLFK